MKRVLRSFGTQHFVAFLQSQPSSSGTSFLRVVIVHISPVPWVCHGMDAVQCRGRLGEDHCSLSPVRIVWDCDAMIGVLSAYGGVLPNVCLLI